MVEELKGALTNVALGKGEELCYNKKRTYILSGRIHG